MQSPRAAVGIDFFEGRSFACWDSIETFPNLREDELSLLALRVLLFDPIVGVTQSDIQTSARLPFQHLLDKSIVAIAASHTARRFEIIFSAQFYLGDCLNHDHKRVNRDELRRTQINWRRY